MICTSHQIFFGDQIEKNDMGGACSEFGRLEVHTGILVGNLTGRVCLEDPAIDGFLILSWNFGKWNGEH